MAEQNDTRFLRILKNLDALGCTLIAPLLTVLLVSCATPLPPCAGTLPMPPEKPQLQQPLPAESYLTRVQRNIEAWGKQLKDTLSTLKP